MPRKLKRYAPFLIAIIALVATAFSPLLAVRNVHVSENQRCVNAESIENKIPIKSKNILLISTKQIAESAKQNFSCIESITIRRSFPFTVKIELISKQPVVKLNDSNIFITESGVLIENSGQENIPTLYLGEDIRPKDKNQITNPLVITALKIASLITKSDFAATNIRIIEGNSIAVYNQQESVAIFSSQKSVDGQVGSLQQVLALAKIGATKIAKIDLRYDKPVIVTK